MSNRKDDDDIYTAECIIKSRIRRGKTEYLVKWKDWSHKYDTWEPRCNIIDPILIQNFERKEEDKKKQTKKKSVKKYVSSEADEESSSDEEKDLKLINSNAPFSETCKNSIKSETVSKEEIETNRIDESVELKDKLNKSNDTKLIDYKLSKSELFTDYADSTDLNTSPDLDDDKDVFDESTNDTLDEYFDDSINNSDKNLKRKVDQIVEKNDLIDGGQFENEFKKSIKFNNSNDQNINHLVKQFNKSTNQSNNDKIIVKKILDKNNNQDEIIENSIHPNGKEFHGHLPNGTNKQLKLTKPDILKKKCNLLDSVVITDVTANNTTITVRESKTQKFFFKDKKSANNVTSQ